jgi:predicted nucleic acid-binding protein
VIALLDNTVLSNFSIVERADLVRLALGDEAATTQTVWDELQSGVRIGRLSAQDWSWLQVFSLAEDEREFYQLLTRRLNAGEASCLAIAARRGCRVLTDDRDARELAAAWQIPISGTLGLLLRLIDIGTLSLTEGDELLARMTAAGYHSPIDTLQEML